MVGRDGPQRQFIEENTEVAPLAYMRGRTMENCVCVLDEAQNCSFEQLVLFMTRMGTNSKMIITGDPMQSDLFASGQVPLSKMIESVGMVEGIGVVEFPEKYIVRHPLVSRLLKKLRELKEQREGGTPPPPREQAFGEGIEPAPVGPYAIRPE
jgi:phosphate starvation-inducible PhoH-like protein